MSSPGRCGDAGIHTDESRVEATVAIAVRTTDYGFIVSGGDVVRVVAASGFAGAAGAILGAGIGAVVRNVGGAVTSTVLVLIIAPPLVVQLVNGSGSWMPGILANVVSGTATDVAAPAAVAALAAWAIIPAVIGLIAIQRRGLTVRRPSLNCGPTADVRGRCALLAVSCGPYVECC